VNKKPANRPRKYAKPTKIVTTRVPLNRVKAFKGMVKKWLKQFEINKK
jgi:hypothetical protein